MNFQSPPNFVHGHTRFAGVLLVNLGTPDAPTASAVRPYLAQFLSDPRVVEIPKLLWMLILHGIILRTRPGKSAAKYRAVWTDQGSPLMMHSKRQAELLQGALGEAIKPGQVKVALAMRYGQPSIQSAIEQLQAQGCDRLFVLPLYPQYAASTTASVNDEVFRVLQKQRWQMAVRTLSTYHDHPGYIAALAARVQKFWRTEGRGDHLLLSFHGIPKRSLTLGDPYHCFCYATGRLLAEALGLHQEQYSVSFQSRFGKAEWLKPYTVDTVKSLAKKSQKLDVFCPGFAADCLETLEEIALEAKTDFLHAGGKEFRYIPALNDHDLWINVLKDLCTSNMHDWLTPRQDLMSKGRAQALGHPLDTD
ncbi:MAG: hypothetical protein RLZZ502_328 [Pseudomonadota bacterium]